MDNGSLALNYKKYGNSNRVAIIVHGLFGMLDNWHNIAKQLSNDFTVYTVDVRNHGGSPHSDEINYELIANDLQAFLDDHSIISSSFIGHSMGGKAVMKLADLHPGSIEKLCVVDIAPKKYKPGHLELMDAMFNLPVKTLESRTEADDLLAEKISDHGIRLFLLKNLQREKNGGFSWKFNLQGIFNNYNGLIDTIELSWPFSNETLFIRGEKSNYINDEDIDSIMEWFPNAEFVTIPNAGHWVHAENPKAFYTALHDFLA